MPKSKPPSADFIYFSKLVWEFDGTESNTELKIRRSLAYYKLGKIDLERLQYIRSFQKDLYAEIRKYQKSKFYRKASNSKFAEMADFDHEAIIKHFRQKFTKIKKSEMAGMVGYAVYLYYLR